jgi:hypothetical protein
MMAGSKRAAACRGGCILRWVSVSFDQFDREAFRERLAKMTDSELIRHGKAARAMSKSGFGEAPREAFVIQLEDCWVEWRRRHPKCKM